MNAISEAVSFLLFDISLLLYARIMLTLLVTVFHSSFHYLFWPLNPSQCHCNPECVSSCKYDLHSYFPVSEPVFGYIKASVIQRNPHFRPTACPIVIYHSTHFHVIANFYQHPENLLFSLEILLKIFTSPSQK